MVNVSKWSKCKRIHAGFLPYFEAMQKYFLNPLMEKNEDS